MQYAGHEYPAIRRDGSGGYELIKTKHYAPLGTMEDNEYREYQLTLGKGDILFLYTDGVTDAKNVTGEKYNTERMTTALNMHMSDNPQETIQSVREDIDFFIGEHEQFDDITMLCIKYYGMDSH
ncbi:MAG: serine/threonine-protein phosphatase [Lachnospiraceae bacterium]|nr:serine/threonine-protein phosphatase [Lachnospiraceae bacterium]